MPRYLPFVSLFTQICLFHLASTNFFPFGAKKSTKWKFALPERIDIKNWNRDYIFNIYSSKRWNSMCSIHNSINNKCVVCFAGTAFLYFSIKLCWFYLVLQIFQYFSLPVFWGFRKLFEIFVFLLANF